MNRRAMDPTVYGPRWHAGERLADLAREIGWNPESLRNVLRRHGYAMTPDQVSARQAETARRGPFVGALAAECGAVGGRASRSSPHRDRTPAAPLIDRLCSLCRRPFQTESRFIRTCEPCKAEMAA